MRLAIIGLFILFINISGKGQSYISYPIFFAYDSAFLDSTEEKRLKVFLLNFESIAIDSIGLTGYCDERGGIVYNDSLSFYRASDVEKKMKGFLNKQPQIITRGKGLIPLENTINIDSQRQLHRRVDMVIYYRYKPVPIAKESFQKKSYKEFLSQAKTGETLDLEINFDGGSHRLRPLSIRKLDTLSDELMKSKWMILIKGHINNYGKAQVVDGLDFETNKYDLSENRAKEVYQYLLSKGISADRLKYQGFGARFPTGISEDKDRRVEIEITGTIKE